MRRPDGACILDLEPGDYARKDGRWWLRLPVDGSQPRPLDGRWRVEEHDDGTITVKPSIEDKFLGWHGYLIRGEWSRV